MTKIAMQIDADRLSDYVVYDSFPLLYQPPVRNMNVQVLTTNTSVSP